MHSQLYRATSATLCEDEMPQLCYPASFELGPLRMNRTVDSPHKSLKMAKKVVLGTLIFALIVIGACECAFKPRSTFDNVLILIPFMQI
jgi:hypothetical protein